MHVKGALPTIAAEGPQKLLQKVSEKWLSEESHASLMRVYIYIIKSDKSEYIRGRNKKPHLPESYIDVTSVMDNHK